MQDTNDNTWISLFLPNFSHNKPVKYEKNFPFVKNWCMLACEPPKKEPRIPPKEKEAPIQDDSSSVIAMPVELCLS